MSPLRACALDPSAHFTSSPVEDPARLVAALDATAEHRATPCADGTLKWRIWGDGMPLVLVHGGHGSWTHWLRNIAHFAKTRRVLVPDLPGHGESAEPETPHSAEQFGAILAAGMDTLLEEGERLDMVGFSFGAVIAGHAAHRLPARVRQFVMVGPGGLALPREPRPNLLQWRDLEDEDRRNEAHRHNLAVLMMGNPDVIDPLAVHLQARNAERGRVKTYSISRTGTLRACLPKLGVPLAGIWGEQDVTARGHFDLRQNLLREIDPAAAFHTIEGAGHWVQFERSETFNACLQEVLDRVP